jgi:hypothetical protein
VLVRDLPFAGGPGECCQWGLLIHSSEVVTFLCRATFGPTQQLAGLARLGDSGCLGYREPGHT